MNVLDSPLDALALNYLSFGFLTLFNNLWTWVAVATAAVSFWRIRAAGCPKPELQLPCDDPISTRPNPVPEVVMPADAGRERAPPPALVQRVIGDKNGDVNVDGVTKGKFTVYYEDFNECGASGELLAVTEGWEEREDRSEGEWWARWERLLRMRRGESENGWYTRQDLTELNGNVVRLWDGGFTTRESWYSSTQSCIHVW